MAAFLQKLISLLMTMLAMFGIGKNTADPAVIRLDNTASYVLSEDKISFTFVSNPSTGYNWSYTLKGGSVKMTKESFEASNNRNAAGAPGKQHYTFTAVKQGTSTVTFTYERPWENNDPVYTYVAVITVDASMHITLDSFTEK